MMQAEKEILTGDNKIQIDVGIERGAELRKITCFKWGVTLSVVQGEVIDLLILCQCIDGSIIAESYLQAGRQILSFLYQHLGAVRQIPPRLDGEKTSPRL